LVSFFALFSTQIFKVLKIVILLDYAKRRTNMSSISKTPLLIASASEIIFPNAEGPLEFIDQVSIVSIEYAVNNNHGQVLLGIKKNTKNQNADSTPTINKYGILATVSIMKK